jgi:hypothetical protein
MTFVKNALRLPSPIPRSSSGEMSQSDEPSAARKWAIRAFLILFIASAAWMAWFGVQQQRLHGAKSDGQPKNPYEDRSLFGR